MLKNIVVVCLAGATIFGGYRVGRQSIESQTAQGESAVTWLHVDGQDRPSCPAGYDLAADERAALRGEDGRKGVCEI